MNPPIDSQLKTMIDNLPKKTGRSLSEWSKVIKAAELENHGDILKYLKEKYEVTHGFANTISIQYRQQLAGGPPSEKELIEEQYSGDKSSLRPIYYKVLASVSKFGSDLRISPKKTYVSLRRNKQFAIIQASTKTRVDLGLNLKNVDPTDRLEGGNVFSGMCTHRVRLSSPSEVDAEVISWLKQAYDQS